MTDTGGKRVYAMGDVHGCRSMLAEMVTLIRADLADHPHPQPVILLVGDYVDRGPDSRGVIEDLIALRADPIETVFLLGNHDEYLLTYLRDPVAPATSKYHWLHPKLGGGETLRSYGVSGADPSDPLASFAASDRAIPQAHEHFLSDALLSWSAGSYLFVHAGIRPGLPLADQDPADLTFIREPFLSDRRDHGQIVVHGHTVVDGIEHHGNRIAIDTGAVFGGVLSCLVVEGNAAFDLRAEGRVPVGPGYGLSARL